MSVFKIISSLFEPKIHCVPVSHLTVTVEKLFSHNGFHIKLQRKNTNVRMNLTLILYRSDAGRLSLLTAGLVTDENNHKMENINL